MAMSYVVTRPAYNFAHWVPHNLLRDIGFDYKTLLYLEQNADIALHLIGAFALTALMISASLPVIKRNTLSAFLIVCSLCLAAEVAQYLLGRGLETRDLLLGILGSFMAYLATRFKN